MDLIEREVGKIPVSIGTSLAFEGYLDIHPNQPKQPLDVKTVKEIWVNLRTLARNLWQAVPTAEVANLNPAAAVDVLMQEVQTIPVALAQNGARAKVRYYITGKDSMKWTFPNSQFKQAKTPKQMAYEVYERYAAIELYRRMKDEGMEVILIERKPPPSDGTVALLTHYPSDLLWKEHFNRLLLLESHTGKLKPWNLWYTKLHNITEATPMPFNKFTLQVFGDGVDLIPQPRNIIGQLKQLALNKRWSPVTTDSKMYHDIQSGNKELKEAYAKLR